MFQGAGHVADEPVGGGGPGGDAHRLVAAQVPQVQFLLGLHVVSGDAGGPGDLHQALGIAAVAASHHHQGLRLAGQFLDLRLAEGGGVADGVEDAGPGEAGLNFLHPLLEMGLALGGLGHHDELVQLRQAPPLPRARHHEAPPPGVAQQARAPPGDRRPPQ